LNFEFVLCVLKVVLTGCEAGVISTLLTPSLVLESSFTITDGLFWLPDCDSSFVTFEFSGVIVVVDVNKNGVFEFIFSFVWTLKVIVVASVASRTVRFGWIDGCDNSR